MGVLKFFQDKLCPIDKILLQMLFLLFEISVQECFVYATC